MPSTCFEPGGSS